MDPLEQSSQVRLPPLIVVLGPTAVGKTEIAIRLAGWINAEIVSADSRLFYRGMDIGTAKPSPEQRKLVPHHLIDVAEPEDVWSLAVFQEQAHLAISSIFARGRQPLLVGGTGQYLRAVTQGWQPPPIKPDPRLRLALENWAQQIGFNGLHQRLAVIDPVAARTIDPRNLRRTIRALEVIFTSGRLFSAQRIASPSPFRLLQLGLILPRPELYARIDARIAAMLAAGLVDEVRGLLERGFSPDSPAFSAIGYREIAAHLQGEITLTEAVQLIQRRTRVYVRRQANWFKPEDPQIHWFQASPDPLNEMKLLVEQFLNEESASKPYPT